MLAGGSKFGLGASSPFPFSFFLCYLFFFPGLGCARAQIDACKVSRVFWLRGVEATGVGQNALLFPLGTYPPCLVCTVAVGLFFFLCL